VLAAIQPFVVVNPLRAVLIVHVQSRSTAGGEPSQPQAFINHFVDRGLVAAGVKRLGLFLGQPSSDGQIKRVQKIVLRSGLTVRTPILKTGGSRLFGELFKIRCYC
jgi:hypothetical protein